MLPVKALLLLIFFAPSLIRGQANLPTLPQAIELFQLESMNNLRETIQRQEGAMAEQGARIAELEGEHVAKDLLIGSMAVENTQLREEFAAKNVEEKDRCETEKTQLREDFAAEILEGESRCENERIEVENQNTHDMERRSAKLQQCESTVVYMGNVMLQNNQTMLKTQNLLESQANTIKEANQEIKRQRNGSLICEAAANSTALQAETITLLRSSLATALEFPQLSTSDLEQLDVAPFMLELMESYNEQTKTIENLKAVLDKEKTVEEHVSELAGELANLTSAVMSATINLDIVDQQAQLIQLQVKSIAQLTPLLRHTSQDVVWYEKAGAEAGGVESVSTCSCLPRSADSSKPTPAKIEYHCGNLSDR